MHASCTMTPVVSVLEGGAAPVSLLGHGSDCLAYSFPPGNTMNSFSAFLLDPGGYSISPGGHAPLAQFQEAKSSVAPAPGPPVGPPGFSTKPPTAFSHVVGASAMPSGVSVSEPHAST